MNSSDIRTRFLSFFEKHEHATIPSSSLVPEGDASTLFTTAGMQPLSAYLLGTPHPKGKRIANIQKCVRTGDIDDVGDNRHLTFFEMLGNWSFGDYFKQEAITWSYELLTSKEEGFGLDPKRLYVTCFEGNADAPKDVESAKVWKEAGIPEERIYFMGAEDNWWSPGPNGPCGPDTEMFYDLQPEGDTITDKDSFVAAQNSGRVVEIWNDVFMEYEQKDGKVVGKLAQQNVDTGAGLERLATVLQEKQSVFETDLFLSLIDQIKQDTGSSDEKRIRIVSDHIRAAVFMIADGVEPSNSERGYVLRRLLRRAKYLYDSLGAKDKSLVTLVPQILSVYTRTDYGLEEKEKHIEKTIADEELKFVSALHFGKKFIEQIIQDEKTISGKNAFLLNSTYGYPLELIVEIGNENHVEVDETGFKKEFEEHQKISRAGSEQKFKGGLADAANPEVVKYHTATHLLNAALKKVLGEHVKQKGSNITPERLRFDFAHPQKMTDDEKKAVEVQMNEWIAADLPVVRKEMSKPDAEALGAEMEFGGKYPDVVSVYLVGQEGNEVSKEFCGGPHVEHTGVLGAFSIIKEESVAAGIRRIKAKLS